MMEIKIASLEHIDQAAQAFLATVDLCDARRNILAFCGKKGPERPLLSKPFAKN